MSLTLWSTTGSCVGVTAVASGVEVVEKSRACRERDLLTKTEVGRRYLVKRLVWSGQCRALSNILRSFIA